MSRADDIAALVAQHLAFDSTAPADSLPLAVPAFGADEIAAAIDTLLGGWLTMGTQCRAFETAWAEAVGVRHSVVVNSGSSALLVLLSALVETGRLSRGDEVVVPAVGWSTSLFAVAQAGLRPVLMDVSIDTLCLEGHFDKPVLAVHLLGQASGATSPMLIEDACGAHGAQLGDRTVGSIGIGGAFSFFFSHHLSTIEGGMITTDADDLADAARSLRAHGWIRERSDRPAQEAQHEGIDPRFLFLMPGFNLRPTEITGAFGVRQVPRLPGFVAKRNENHRTWCAAVDALGLPLRVFPERPGTLHSGFAFPMLLDAGGPLDRATLCARLAQYQVDSRPISGSNLSRQPAFDRVPGVSIEGPLDVADAVHERGLFVGQSHAFDGRHLDLLCRALRGAFDG